MRSIWKWSALVAPWAFALACAGGDEPQSPSDEPLDAGETSRDGTPSGGDADAEPPLDSGAEAGLPCSEGGWCRTVVPTNALDFRDIWPSTSGAFAIAEMEGRNAILEFDEVWAAIHAPAVSLTSVWAASSDDVWVGTDDGTMLHGARTPTSGNGADGGGAPRGSFVWTTEVLSDVDVDPAGVDRIEAVWGTGSTDLYAAATALPAEIGAPPAARLYHRSLGEDGLPTWRLVLREDGNITFHAVVGTRSDDIWIFGTRSDSNVYAARKTATGFVPLVDGQTGFLTCNVRPPAVACAIGGALSGFAPRAGEAVVVVDDQRRSAPPRLVRFHDDTAADGGVSSTEVPLPFPFGVQVTTWGSSSDDLYVAGPSQVFHADQPWSEAALDGGQPFTVSSVALNGAPLLWPFRSIRGSASNDVWVVGAFHALHKQRHEP